MNRLFGFVLLLVSITSVVSAQCGPQSPKFMNREGAFISGPNAQVEKFFKDHSYFFFGYKEKSTIWGDEFPCESCTSRKGNFSLIKQNKEGDIIKTITSERPGTFFAHGLRIYNDSIYLVLRLTEDTLSLDDKSVSLKHGGLAILVFDLNLNLLIMRPLVESLKAGNRIFGNSNIALNDRNLYFGISLLGDFKIGGKPMKLDSDKENTIFSIYAMNKEVELLSSSSQIHDDFHQPQGLEVFGNHLYYAAMINNNFRIEEGEVLGISKVDSENETDFVLFHFKDSLLVNHTQYGSIASDRGTLIGLKPDGTVLLELSCGTSDLQIRDSVIYKSESPYTAYLIAQKGMKKSIVDHYTTPISVNEWPLFPKISSLFYIDENRFVLSVNYGDSLEMSDLNIGSLSQNSDSERSNSVFILYENKKATDYLHISSSGQVYSDVIGVLEDNRLRVIGYFEKELIINGDTLLETEKSSYLINLCFDDLESGIKKMSATNFHLYPNPSSTQVQLKFATQIDQNTKARIFNSQGQLLSTYNIHQGNGEQTIDISSLAKGLYLIRIENNKTVQQQWLVKE